MLSATVSESDEAFANDAICTVGGAAVGIVAEGVVRQLLSTDPHFAGAAHRQCHRALAATLRVHTERTLKNERKRAQLFQIGALLGGLHAEDEARGILIHS